MFNWPQRLAPTAVEIYELELQLIAAKGDDVDAGGVEGRRRAGAFDDQ